MRVNVCPLKIVSLQLSSKRKRSFATVAFASREIPVKRPKLHNEKAHEPIPSLFLFLAQTLELLLLDSGLLELASHQIEKVNTARLVAEK